MNAPAIVQTTEVAILQSLADHAEAARGAYAPSTERALRDDVAKFSGWCSAAGLGAMPAAPKTIAAFIEAQAQLGRKPASIRRYVSSISTFHRAAEVQNPCESLTVKLALKRMHRELGRAQRQAAPLNRPQVEQMLRASGDSLRALRDRALLATCYDTLMRESEIVALLVSDLEFSPDGSGVVTIRRSKTDQEGQGMRRYIHIDTVSYLRQWLATAGHSDGAVFRSVPKGGRLGGALAAPEVARILRRFAQRAGVEAKGVSGHSCRVGAAQDQVAAGLDLVSVMQSGGWSSAAMPARYSAKLAARRSGSARLAALQGR
jgi:site-specific recombinase XerD